MTEYIIYPSGNPVNDPDSDTKRINTAIASASDGDTIVLSNELQSGGPQDWLLGDDLTDDQVYIARDGVKLMPTYGSSLTFTFNQGTYLGDNDKQFIRVDKAITIKGVIDGNGDPITRITYQNPKFVDGNTTKNIPSDMAPFLILNKFSTIQDLLFDGPAYYGAIFYFHPCHIKNIHLENCERGPVTGFVDNRVTYAGFSNGDYSNPYNAILEDIKHGTGRANTNCLDPLIIEHSGCIVRRYIATATLPLGSAIYLCALASNSAKSAGLMKYFDCNESRDILVEDSEFYHKGPWGINIHAWWGPKTKDVVIRNCHFEQTHAPLQTPTPTSGSFGLEISQNPFPWYPPNNLYNPEISDVMIEGCTFKNFARPIANLRNSYAATRGLLVPYNCIIADCKVVRDSGTRGAPEVSLLDADNFVFSKNDYTDSGAPGILTDGVVGGTHFLGENTSCCIVHDSGGFPAGQGGADNHITDLGYKNRVVGLPANEIESPKGIGQAIKSQLTAISEANAVEETII